MKFIALCSIFTGARGTFDPVAAVTEAFACTEPDTGLRGEPEQGSLRRARVALEC